MPHAVTVYRWDDPGAPQIPNGKPSEIIDVLTKCLVNGYGSKTSLGWSRPFYDAVTQAAVFRNNITGGGSGGFAKFYSDTGNDVNNAVMRVTHALSMTGINDFFRKGYTHAFQAASGTASTKMDKWVLIGTAIGFYFFISRNTSPMSGVTYNATMYIGDFYSSVASDTARFISIASPTTSDTSAVSTSNTLDNLAASVSASVASLKIYHADNFDGFNNYALAPFVGSGAARSSYDLEPTTEHILMPWLIRMTSENYNDSVTLDRLGVFILDSIVSPLFRGVLPGIGSSLKAGYRLKSWPTTKIIGGVSYWLLRASNNAGCNAWLNMEQWNDPFGNV